MKKIGIILILLLIFPLVSAINLEIERQSSEEILIIGLNKPVVFDLEVKNLGQTDNFEFYNLVGLSMTPVGLTQINSGQTKNIELTVFPIGEFPHRGYFTFDCFVQARDKSQTSKKLTFKTIELKDAFEISAGEINSEENSANFAVILNYRLILKAMICYAGIQQKTVK